mmetsp:Transcript_14349/g.21800  ORF Transcript_14349/g.21800 Transcript_14349/m.21800 type:complete len:368 (+) Transcript_14349:79-1182(+)
MHLAWEDRNDAFRVQRGLSETDYARMNVKRSSTRPNLCGKWIKFVYFICIYISVLFDVLFEWQLQYHAIRPRSETLATMIVRDVLFYIFVIYASVYAVKKENVAMVFIGTFNLCLQWTFNLGIYFFVTGCENIRGSDCALLLTFGTVLNLILLAITIHTSRTFGWRTFIRIGLDLKNIKCMTAYQTYIAGAQLCGVHSLTLAFTSLVALCTHRNSRVYSVTLTVSLLLIILDYFSNMNLRNERRNRFVITVATASTIAVSCAIWISLLLTKSYEGHLKDSNSYIDSIAVYQVWLQTFSRCIIVGCAVYLHYIADDSTLHRALYGWGVEVEMGDNKEIDFRKRSSEVSVSAYRDESALPSRLSSTVYN